ncbi:hypothetical protein ACFCXA_14450 [Streptomyces virginiae]|uniref:hypothetical protein n=1 Tax=Streptomyces virginiae TaxID=1961 RepID=UPI0035D56B98
MSVASPGQRALDRTAAGGLTAGPETVRAVLTGSEAFAEDLAERLLGAPAIESAVPGEDDA